MRCSEDEEIIVQLKTRRLHRHNAATERYLYVKISLNYSSARI